MTKTIKNKILNMEHSERKIFWCLALFVAAFSGLYMYFVNGAIVNVVERQKIEKEIAALNSRISDLESSYLDLNNQISFNRALSMGFVKMADEKYVFRKTLSANLSFNQSN
ncbi:MAG: hypothetical protein KGJ58_00835 [Patescibacteria group bacterium]|nr:hypothetical protein [Patescibacteria group bacterium]MDE1988169.1 hypothetical protein [Patescibacteria group bacterium]MDE2217989.1 hypothetical protein [Patescibacteria group bacterium]